VNIQQSCSDSPAIANQMDGVFGTDNYAHLAPNYVTDTIRGSFPRLTGSTAPIVVPFGRSRMSRSKAS